jgi:Fe2+ or Zn2+ uptake regulation protein
MVQIEATNCTTLRNAVLAVFKQHKGKPGVERLIEAYRDAEKNAPQCLFFDVVQPRHR